MRASLIKIGNSQGVRIPKAIIEQCGFQEEVEFEVQKNELVIKSLKKTRQNWEKSFRSMAKKGDDKLLDSDSTTAWDEAEWEWK